MKKFFTCYLILFLCFSLTGCSESHEDEIKSTVVSYFTAIQAGSYEEALKSTIGEHKLKDNFGLSEIENSIEDLKDDSMGDVYNQEAIKFKNYMLSKSILDYTLGSIKEDSTEAIVNISGNCVDFAKFDPTIKESDLNSLIDTYILEHEDEIKKLMSEQGEDIANQKILDDCAPLLFDQMKKNLDIAASRGFKMQIVLNEMDGQWKISQIDEIQ